jgi:hypothetical protein
VVEEDGELLAEGEVVNGLPVVAEDEDGALEGRPTTGGVVSVTNVQAAALVASSFVAGAATVAVVSRRRARKAAKKRKKAGPLGEIVGSNSFLIDVHLLRRD